MSEIKLTFSVDEKTANRIDRFWHSRRLANRSDALRILVKQGLLDLEDRNESDSPTQKQIDLVKALCKERGIEPPEQWSLQAYQSFIARNLKKKTKTNNQ